MKKLAWAVMAAVCVSSFGFADEEPKPDPNAAFNKLDANSDGKLSFEEFKGTRDEERARKAFDRNDKNKDGSLSADEFNAIPKPNSETAFKKADKNSDGKLTYEEFKGMREEEAAKKAFGRLDKDKDGSLTLTEFMAPPPQPTTDKAK